MLEAGEQSMSGLSEPKLLGLREAAVFLRLNPRTLSHLAQHGRVPAKKVGGVWRFHREALEQWLAHDNQWQPTPAAPVAAAVPAQAATGRPRALIVDDDPSYRELLTLQLRDDYETLTAASGAEALLKTGLGRPDLIVLDLVLPDIHGRDLCRLIRAQPELERTAILIVSGVDDSAEVARTLKLGADDYVVKPFRPLELLARAQRLLERTGRLPVRP